jgi:ABC-2 type transport system permease protein
MIRAASNILALGLKELRSLAADPVMLVLIVWAFFFSVLVDAESGSEIVNNSSVAIADQDDSRLSRAIAQAIYPPWFQRPEPIAPPRIDAAMDRGEVTFVIEVPPGFERDVHAAAAGGRPAEIQIAVDATASLQAAMGSGYLAEIVAGEVAAHLERAEAPPGIALVQHRAFNPNGEDAWFYGILALLDQLSLITIVLTGAAMLREREHGTIEHLMVMPVTAVEIALAKVAANAGVVLVAFLLSLAFVIRGILGVPIAGSLGLLVSGTALYLFSAAAIGIFLGTLARSMAQFALLVLLAVMMMMMLSGGQGAVEAQPDWVQRLTWFLPSRHFLEFAKSVIFRGAGAGDLVEEIAAMAGLGAVFFAGALALFRRSMSV